MGAGTCKVWQVLLPHFGPLATGQAFFIPLQRLLDGRPTLIPAINLGCTGEAGVLCLLVVASMLTGH
jgi:hypothetical protein